MGNYTAFPSQTPQVRPKPPIYTPRRDEEHRAYASVSLINSVFANTSTACGPSFLLKPVQFFSQLTHLQNNDVSLFFVVVRG